MSGRLQQIIVLAVAMVTLQGSAIDAQQDGCEMADPNELSNFFNEFSDSLNELSDSLNELSDSLNQGLNEIANRCRSLAGEQAAANLINIPTTLMNCINMQQLYAEIVPEWPDLRKIAQVICRKKDCHLTCAKEGLQILNRCLPPEEKKHTEMNYQILEATENFLCNNIDDIASIAFEEEKECIGYMAEKGKQCAIQKNGTNDEEFDFEKYLGSKEETCKVLEEKLHCVTDGGDKCKDSDFHRILSSYVNEVLDAISCPNSGRGGAAGLLAPSTAPTSVMVSLVICLGVPRVLHLQLTA